MEAFSMVIIVLGLVYAVVLFILPFVVVSINNKIKVTNELLETILKQRERNE